MDFKLAALLCVAFLLVKSADATLPVWYPRCRVIVNGPKRTERYVEEAFQLVLKKPGVEEVLIMNRSGVPVKTSMARQDALQHACLYDNLREKTQAFLQKMEPPQNLCMLRVRTKMHEVIITPDAKITILVVQNAKDAFLGNQREEWTE